MNELQIFKNPEFGTVRVIEKDGEPWFVGKDITEILEYQNGSRDINRHVDEEDRCKIMVFDGRQNKETIIVNESGVYSLIILSKMPEAKKFKRWVTNEVLPTINKHGAYITPEKLEEVLLNPDTLIQLAQNLKTEQEARKKAEKELAFKNDVIQGLVDDIPLADKRRRISQIIRKGCLDPHVLGIRWNMLYNEFEMKHHMNLDKRMQSEPKIKTKIEFIDKKLNMIPELYDVCCKLYTGEYKKLMKELECATN